MDMVDSTTLIVLSTVAQTIVITITLIVFIMQFRSQEKALKESSYQGLMGRYNDYIRTALDKPVLAKMMISRMGSRLGNTEEVSEDQATVYANLLVAYGIIEEAYQLYKKDWIDEDNWLQWSAFLEGIAQFPEFARIHYGTAGTFDGEFQDYVTKMLQRLESTDKK
jgi:hypothetical protein